MAQGIDLPAVAAVTGVPHATLRYWVQQHGWESLGKGRRGAYLYDAATVMHLAKKHPAFLQRLEAETALIAAGTPSGWS